MPEAEAAMWRPIQNRPAQLWAFGDWLDTVRIGNPPKRLDRTLREQWVFLFLHGRLAKSDQVEFEKWLEERQNN